jgi:hypothetical protein
VEKLAANAPAYCSALPATKKKKFYGVDPRAHPNTVKAFSFFFLATVYFIPLVVMIVAYTRDLYNKTFFIAMMPK